MDAIVSWSQAHAAVVHFPIALTFFALGCAATAWARWLHPTRIPLQAATDYSLWGAALGSLPAVLSGLYLTHGELIGHGTLRQHHQFGWPAFALLVGMALWRALQPPPATRETQRNYLLVLGLLAGLMAATGHWGGRLTLASP